MFGIEKLSAADIQIRLIQGTIDINALDLARISQREAFFAAIEKRPALLSQVKPENAAHLLGAAIKKKHTYFIYLDKKQYTPELADLYIYQRLAEHGAIKNAVKIKNQDNILIQKSLDDKTLISYFYSADDDDAINYFDKDFDVFVSLKSSFKLMLKINDSLKLINKLDMDVKQLGAGKIKTVICDIIENQYKAFLYSYINDEDVGYYSLCTAYEDIERGIFETFNRKFADYGISVVDFIIKRIAIPKDILFKVEDHRFKLKQRKADIESEAELAKISLASYEAKLAVQEKYPSADHSLTEYEKDRALERYLVKNGRAQEEVLDHRIAMVQETEDVDKQLHKVEDVVPDIPVKKNNFFTIFICMLAVSLLAVCIAFANSVGVGFILLGIAVLVNGVTVAFNYPKLLKKKMEVPATTGPVN